MLDPYLSLNTYINFKWNKKLSVKNEIKYCTKKINNYDDKGVLSEHESKRNYGKKW